MAASFSRRKMRAIIRLLGTASESPKTFPGYDFGGASRWTSCSWERLFSVEIRTRPDAVKDESEIQAVLHGAVADSRFHVSEFAALQEKSTFGTTQFDQRDPRNAHSDCAYTKNSSARGELDLPSEDLIPAFLSAEDVATPKVDYLPNSLFKSTLSGPCATERNLWPPRSPLLLDYNRARADLTAKICFVRSFHATNSAGDDSRVCSSDVSTALDPKQLRGHDSLLEGCSASRRFFSRNQHISDDSKGKVSTSERLESISADKSTETTYKSWIQRVLPEKFWPYAKLARLDKPIGSWLLAWPCVWSICLAAPSGSLPDPVLLGLFVTGAFLLRGAGCTVNDLWDRDIDKMVERTRDRPLASGALTPFQGLSFLALQLSAGLGILLQLNLYSQALGVISVLLFGTYPLMKRVTFWPQAYLGATFNWGALMGWAAVHGSLQLSAVLPLYAAGICWTLVYDTIYAHQDKEDDIRVGVKSTALLFGTQTQTWLAGFSTACIANLALAGWTCNLGWPFYLGLVGAAGHLGWQVLSVDIHNGSDCNSKFVSNKWFGAVVATGVVLGKIASLPA